MHGKRVEIDMVEFQIRCNKDLFLIKINTLAKRAQISKLKYLGSKSTPAAIRKEIIKLQAKLVIAERWEPIKNLPKRIGKLRAKIHRLGLKATARKHVIYAKMVQEQQMKKDFDLEWSNYESNKGQSNGKLQGNLQDGGRQTPVADNTDERSSGSEADSQRVAAPGVGDGSEGRPTDQ